MGDLSFADNKKFTTTSKHMILDSGLSYALIPSADYKALTQMIESNYGVKCTADKDKQQYGAQVASSDCSCKDYDSVPSLKMQLLATAEDTKGQIFEIPREAYLKN